MPDHNTISNFRKDNSVSIKNVFRATVEMAKYFDLIGGNLIAGDSTKMRAQNSKKNNFNSRKIERHLAYIEQRLAQYQQELAKEDGDTESINKEIKKHKQRKQKYEALQKELENSDQEQISTSDPDSKQMIIRNNITEVAYNVQSTTDAKHHIPIDYKVTNNNACPELASGIQRLWATWFKGLKPY